MRNTIETTSIAIHMNLDKYNTIIWDWNGTLLDDVDMCIGCMNQLLEPRNIPLIDKKIYQEVFTFPVKDYYEKVGVDFKKDPFDIIGHHFMDLYFQALPSCHLHKDAAAALQYFQKKDKKQFILSAMEHEALIQSSKDYQIEHFFEAIYGIDNHLAAGKIGRAHQMMKTYNIDPDTAIMIGDTLHDKEVAEEMGIAIILVANGHQNLSRLKNSGAVCKSQLSDILTHS